VFDSLVEVGNSHTGKVPVSFLSSYIEFYVMRSEYDSRKVAVSRVATSRQLRVYLLNQIKWFRVLSLNPEIQ